jgi:2-deoxy-D-gluconate 3-dehydrogenase
MSAPSPSIPALALFDLSGKTALVTGATRGIGQACAQALADAGASVCLVSRTTNPTLPVPADKHGHVVCDLSDMDAVKNVFEEARVLMGGEIHILVNCAGIQRRAPSVDFTEADWDDVRAPPRSRLFRCSLWA